MKKTSKRRVKGVQPNPTPIQERGYAMYFKLMNCILVGLVFIYSIYRPEYPKPKYMEIVTYENFIDETEIACLAKNMYFEARNEGTAGVLAVTNVVLNRVQSDKYPNTICAVIEEAKISKWWLKEKGIKMPIKHQCQFSWFCDGKPDIIKNQYVYNQLYDLSKSIIDSNFKNLMDITDGALWYHADYVHPKWAKSFEKTTKIGRHIFYREKG